MASKKSLLLRVCKGRPPSLPPPPTRPHRAKRGSTRGGRDSRREGRGWPKSPTMRRGGTSCTGGWKNTPLWLPLAVGYLVGDLGQDSRLV